MDAITDAIKPEFRRVAFDDYGIKWKVRCPYCGIWGFVTDEQRAGEEEKRCANFRCDKVIIKCGSYKEAV